MNSEVAWVLVSSASQVQPQIILDPDYLPDYLSVSYDYVQSYYLKTNNFHRDLSSFCKISNHLVKYLSISYRFVLFVVMKPLRKLNYMQDQQ